jgi:hypothetical protein
VRITLFRIAALVLAMGGPAAAWPYTPESELQGRAMRAMALAERTLAAGELDASRAAQLEFVVFFGPEAAWAWKSKVGQARKAELSEHLNVVLDRHTASVIAPLVVAARDRAVAAFDRARNAKRLDPKHFVPVQENLDECTSTTLREGADLIWVVPAVGLSLTQLEEECAALALEAAKSLETATAVAAEREKALRATLQGERLATFLKLGEPTLPEDGPSVVARAKSWTYVTGPSGPLRTYETLVFEWKGDKVSARRRVTSHEHP